MSPQEHLQRARARLADPERWTQHEQARDIQDARVEPSAASAVCWSADGALDSDRPYPDRQAVRALYLAARERGARCIGEFNDRPGRTHAEVVALYDRAIAIAIERGDVFVIGREYLWAEFGLFCATLSRVRVLGSCPDPRLSSADGPMVVKARDASGRAYRTRANDLLHLDGAHVLTSLPMPPDADLKRAIVRLEAERASLCRAPRRPWAWP